MALKPLFDLRRSFQVRRATTLTCVFTLHLTLIIMSLVQVFFTFLKLKHMTKIKVIII